jgi:hypothetical protein
VQARQPQQGQRACVHGIYEQALWKWQALDEVTDGITQVLYWLTRGERQEDHSHPHEVSLDEMHLNYSLFFLQRPALTSRVRPRS